ncbi:MAG: tetratricopeptide repeat protein [Saprospiraceae bacterium]
MNLEEKYTLIEKYLAEEMQGMELEKFEAQLQTDAELKEELNLHRQVTETLKGEKVHQLRSVLNDVDKNWETPSKKEPAKVVNFNFRRILTIAAAFALLVIGYQWFTNSDLSSEELYAANFETYPMLLNQRSAEENNASSVTYNNAITFYNKKDFTQAEAAFAKLLQDQPDNVSFQFYQANIFLSSQNAANAIPIFQKIIDDNNPLFEEQARWYLSLAYLQLDQKENAKVLLEKIQQGQFRAKEASNILDDL